MPIQTSSNLSNSVRVQYHAQYLKGAMSKRLYDQLASPIPGADMKTMMQGSSYRVPFLSSMAPGVSTIPLNSDVTPQILTDAVASVTPTSRWGAIQWHEDIDIKAYTDYGARRHEIVGENMQESIEYLAVDAATQGSWVTRAAARASLDAGTAGHRMTDAELSKIQGLLLSLKIPGFITNDGSAVWAALMHPFVFHDLRESGNVDSIGLYQDRGIHLSWELGQIGAFRLVVSPWVKVFGGAGADNGTNVATTLAARAERLATTITTAADVSANIGAGLLWTIGTEETAGTNYPTNERVKIVSANATALTILGEGENGGLKYAHEIGEAVRNADSVYPVVYGGPESLVKLFATDIGEYGQIVGPKVTGVLDQFTTLGWKFYGGYARLTENRLIRGEYSTSYEA